MRHAPAQQIDLFSGEVERTNDATASTFSDNLYLPIHRWFRYSAGFSALWVRELIERQQGKGGTTVLDPFAGCGTVLLEGEWCDAEAVGVEAHPFVARVAHAKLHWREDARSFRGYALRILGQAKRAGGTTEGYPNLIQKCFPPETLQRLDALRRAWEAIADDSPLSELAWLTLGSILRDCSPVGTAQWQYVLPSKSKAKTVDPYDAFQAKLHLMSTDMATRQRQVHGPQARLYHEDARDCASIPDGWASLIVTSPPYANNYDYADATRLEMTFWRQIDGWGDLQNAVRKYLVRSCTQHVAMMTSKTAELLQAPLLGPIREEITDTCQRLQIEREKHGGKKPYHTMIAAYFGDMARTWIALRRVAAEGALVCFVIGDSAPYGIYVPVDRWLGELAIAAGFDSYRFEKTRDRNVKWRNRKHRVPLHEGRLWIEG